MKITKCFTKNNRILKKSNGIRQTQNVVRYYTKGEQTVSNFQSYIERRVI